MSGAFTPAESAQIAGQSTAPLGGSASSTAGPTSSLTFTTSSTLTQATSTPSATNAANSAMGIKAGWVGLVFGALVGATVL